MLKLVARAPAAILLFLCLAVASAGVRTLLAGAPPPRGELVDLGGRRIRVVCEGPRSGRPLVVLESGIFGFAADWGEVQARLARDGWRSCAYDRADLGFSDPGPLPRDGLAVVADEEAWLKAKGETGPLILVGHSMAGVHTRIFALRNPDRVKGLVLVDAMSPEVARRPLGRKLLKMFDRLGTASCLAARFGLLKLAPDGVADGVGLSGAAHEEKRFMFGQVRHMCGSALETAAAGAAVDQARKAGALDPELPVAAVTEGPQTQGDWGRGRIEAALKSRHGYVENRPDGTHATLLGPSHADAIVRAVDKVAAAVSNS